MEHVKEVGAMEMYTHILNKYEMRIKFVPLYLKVEKHNTQFHHLQGWDPHLAPSKQKLKLRDQMDFRE